ncbi:MAG: hypothetical protein FJ031_11525 [Chloroflexi bacterium]|nr:hypothetical protein [Chloroflexota bacterium]
MTRLFVRFISLALLASLLLSCAAPAALPTSTPQHFAPFILVTQDPNASATPTPFQPSGLAETPLPTFTASPPPTATFTSTPPATATFPPPPSPTTGSVSPTLPTSSRTNYILYSTLDFQNKNITTDQTIRYYNNTGTTLSDIVLSVQPNIYTNAFVLNSIAQDGTPITSYAFSGQRLTVNLPQPLGAGSATTLTLNFKLNIPQKSSSDVFGYDFNQINLVDWYPFIVPHRGGWILHDPSSWGEHLVYDASDFELNIKTDSDVILAIGASPEQNGEWTRYRMYGARTLAISASDEFIVSETTSGSIAIRSYYFSGFQTGGADMLTYASQAIDTFSAQFAPYPHQTLAIVQTDMSDGMEYDGLIFLSSNFYKQYNGTARSNLAAIGVHEIAHQWWYSLVGNDHALEPWLDETLSTYSERIFYENNYPANVSWWWQFRVDYFKPTGYVDGSIYQYDSFRNYTNATYFQGARFLDEMREQMGYGNFSKFIKEYATRYSYGHATTADFFALAREIVNINYDTLQKKYFSGSY